MRGLFNAAQRPGRGTHQTVSIRLADAWPFQPRGNPEPEAPGWAGFNPPCGCVAFSTRIEDRRMSSSAVSIRLADAWPFQPARRSRAARGTGRFQSALRMRGLFNAKAPVLHSGRRSVSIRLADAWPFQLWPYTQGTIFGIIMFQSALRMRGLFNDRFGFHVGKRCGVSIRLADAWPFQQVDVRRRLARHDGFNPPCGCVAFSTRALSSCGLVGPPFQSALRMRGLFNVSSPKSL